MPFEEVKFEFPHEAEDSKEVEVEETDAVEIDLSGKKTEEDYKKEQVVEPEEESEDDLDIEVVDDTPEEDQGREASEAPEDVTEQELEGYSSKVKKRINKIQKGYHDERRAKESAERERQEAVKFAEKLANENRTLKQDVSKNREAMLEQAKRSSAIEVLTAKKAYKMAYDAGDADKVMEAQDKLTTAKIKADKLQNFKPEPLQEDTSSVTIPDNASAQDNKRAEEWVSRNPWFETDPEMNSLAMGVHNKLVAEGVNTDSDEYYEKIDTRMRQVFPDNFEDAPKKKRANVVAPATRSTAPKKVTLTQTQVRLAKRLGLTNEQYAKQLVQDMRN